MRITRFQQGKEGHDWVLVLEPITNTLGLKKQNRKLALIRCLLYASYGAEHLKFPFRILLDNSRLPRTHRKSSSGPFFRAHTYHQTHQEPGRTWRGNSLPPPLRGLTAFHQHSPALFIPHPCVPGLALLPTQWNINWNTAAQKLSRTRGNDVSCRLSS